MATGVNIHNADSLTLDVSLTASGVTFYPTAADAAAATNAITFPATITGDEDYYIPKPAGDVTVTVSIKHNGRELAGVDGTGDTIILGRNIVAQIGAKYDSLSSLAKGEKGGTYKGQTNIVAATGATETVVDLDTADIQFWTLDSNCTVTFPTDVAEGHQLRLFLKQDGTGSRIVTWPAGIKWPSSTAPTLTTTAAKTDSLRFIYVNAAWYGMVDGLSLG